MTLSQRFRSHYANVVSTLALCVALGGTSYAAVTITGKDVRNGSLTGKDVKKSSLTTRQVKNGSLLAADFKAGQLRSAGNPGPQGAQGVQGPAGPQGPAGVSADFFEDEQESAMNVADSKRVDVTCPLGTFALGGGYEIWDNNFPPIVPVIVTQSTSLLSTGGITEGWTVLAKETAANDTPWKLTAWVSCAG